MNENINYWIKRVVFYRKKYGTGSKEFFAAKLNLKMAREKKESEESVEKTGIGDYDAGEFYK